MDDFDEGEHILTLKDSRILDGDGQSRPRRCASPRSSRYLWLTPPALLRGCRSSAEDELENEDLERLAKDAKDKELKKKQPGYSAYDDDEFDPDMVGKKRKVLSKYDVDIDGEQDGVSTLLSCPPRPCARVCGLTRSSSPPVTGLPARQRGRTQETPGGRAD